MIRTILSVGILWGLAAAAYMIAAAGFLKNAEPPEEEDES